MKKLMVFIICLIFILIVSDVSDTGIHYNSLGYYRKVGINSREYFVYDVNSNGLLEELPATIVAARSYPHSMISVASGRYGINEPLVINQNNAFQEIRGNNTFLDLPAGYSGNAIIITSNKDLSSFKMSGITWQDKEPHTYKWDGLRATLGSGADLQMSNFDMLTFRYCNRAIYVVLTGNGWMNANDFTETKAHSPVMFLEVNRSGTGPYFDGNTFTNTRIQAVAGVTKTGVIMAGNANIFHSFYFWDATEDMKGVIFGSNSQGNQFYGVDFDMAGFTDNSAYKANYLSGRWDIGHYSLFRQTSVNY